ncbi:MAG: ribonuclease HI [Gemmatimonadota bacterium]|nr:ribonuclease HI [Gemmatimonadota bacterium]MDH5196180.1 ribonuclease HI [Gemmatimonadota bacterium]
MQTAVVHADESCLGNGREGATPGGAGALIEVEVKGAIERRDLYVHAPDTTNNRMALAGAIATFALLSTKGRRLRVVYVSDSEYLVKGMREWVPSWRARGWKRKGGSIENLELWQALLQVQSGHEVTWRWVRGHAGDAKNEYADHLAVRAAKDQITSQAAEPSGLATWLESRRAKGHFSDYDPDAEFAIIAAQLES